MQWSFFGPQSVQDIYSEVCLLCGGLKSSPLGQMKSDLSAEQERKSIEWLTLILQNQPVRVGFYLCAGTWVWMQVHAC